MDLFGWSIIGWLYRINQQLAGETSYMLVKLLALRLLLVAGFQKPSLMFHQASFCFD
jgi:hypothetical protein